MVRVGAERDAYSFAPGNAQERQIYVLSIGIAVDLDRFVQSGRFGKDSRPIGGETQSEVVNATAGMTLHVNIRITYRTQISFRLVFRFAKRRMEGAEN